MNQFNPKNNGGTVGRTELGFQDLERLNQSPEMQQVINEEFGTALEGVSEGDDSGVSRRRWLQLMGASLALGAAAGCRYQPEKILPYAFRPQNRVPGAPVRYASMIDFAGMAHPIEAVSYDGRPVKLDGNRLHPETMSLSEHSPGTSSAFTQARILELYDPDRLRSPLVKSTGGGFQDSDWNTFIAAFRGVMSGADLSSVAVLAEPSASPSVSRLQQEFESRGGKWYVYSPLGDDNARAGSRMAFEQVVRPQYSLDKAKVVVCLDADPLHFDGGAMRNNRLFAQGRDVEHAEQMSRLYAVESEYSITGASADHRMSLPSSQIASFLGSLAAEVNSLLEGGSGSVNRTAKYRTKLLGAMAKDLVANKGAGLIIVGERQPPEVHAAAHLLNEKLENIGQTVTFTVPLDAARGGMIESLQSLKGGIESGAIKTLVIVAGNPAYDAPYDLGVGAAISSCATKIHLSYYKNETSVLCDWVFNLAHGLESWGDGLSYDGTWCLAQPLLSPLFAGRSVAEVLASAIGAEDVGGQAIVEMTAKQKFGESGFDALWSKAVHDGFFEKSQAEPVVVKATEVAMPANDGAWMQDWDGKSITEMVFVPSRSVYDGRFANNGWLQELPDFITKITWDNAAMVNPETAKALGLVQNRLYTFSFNNESVTLPVHIQPGQARGSIAVAIGYGRSMAGAVGGHVDRSVAPVGFDVSPLRSSSQWYVNKAVKVDATRGTAYPLAVIQENWNIDSVGRNEIQSRMFMDKDGNRSALIREGSFESYKSFLAKHPIGEHADHGDGHAELQGGKVHAALATVTSLPIINASFTPVDDKAALAAEHHDDHHEPKWPESFHEHELFDLTPGVRMIYTAQNPENKNSWGMSIDLNKCTGCNSCVVACQSENNVPIVGKNQVYRGREMHWLRLDRYFGSNLYNTEAAESDDKMIIHQPVACHHCENAPCETVCPVAATVHSSEGLNDMVYNRCIGTRYCGNNCPYKVRRFNYLNYTDSTILVKYPNDERLSKPDRSLQNLMMNPEVTIRSRGVMEKCTYCVQRIQNVKILAKTQGNRPIGANEITAACQDACPTGAIKFGDINHVQSDVHHLHKNPRSYAMLSELNNIPRTKYLARVRNPHPDLMDMDDRGVKRSGGGVVPSVVFE